MWGRVLDAFEFDFCRELAPLAFFPTPLNSFGFPLGPNTLREVVEFLEDRFL